MFFPASVGEINPVIGDKEYFTPSFIRVANDYILRIDIHILTAILASAPKTLNEFFQ
jgi:hypothetical protein